MNKPPKNAQPHLEQIRQFDNEHWLHPWEPLQNQGRANRPIIVRGEGIFLYDEHGSQLIDGPAGMWCVQLGYGRKEIADAIAEQAQRLAYINPFSHTCETTSHLAKKIAELTPNDLNHVFFTTGGSTAVDCALRFVQFYNNIHDRPEKKHFIYQAHSYHGATYLSAQITSKERQESRFDVNAHFVHALPSISESMISERQGTPEDLCEAAVKAFEAKILSIGPERVGAFIAEPIQAAGGIIVPPYDYLRQCLEICRKYEILYISDEVVTGFGRLGHWFASKDVFQLDPDIITCAKGLSSGYLPIGAFIVSERIIESIRHDNAKGAVFMQGFTYSGHPVSSAAALKNISLFEEERLLEHVITVSPYFQSKLQELQELDFIQEIRGMGLLGAVQCNLKPCADVKLTLARNKSFAQAMAKECRALGLLIRPYETTAMLSPPLIITEEQIDLLFTRLRQGLTLAMRDYT